MKDKIRVTILDDHQSIIDGYLFRLKDTPQVEVVATLSYGDEIEPSLMEHPSDVLLLDVNVPSSADNSNPYPILHVIPNLLQLHPGLNILVISMHAERGLIRAVIESGASGYILKDDQSAIRDLGNVVTSVASGGIYFSQKAHQLLFKGRMEESEALAHRQMEALSLCAAYPNSTTAEIGQMMSISNSTVRNLLSGAYLKLGVHTRAAAIAKAHQLGILMAEPPTMPLHLVPR